MKKDLYGAYIIIPSTFSTAVDSINGTPQKAVFEYQINPHLEGQDRDNMIYELTAFQDSTFTKSGIYLVKVTGKDAYNNRAETEFLVPVETQWKSENNDNW